MNIAIISPQIYPCVTGGVEIFNYYLIKELAKRGHKIFILTTCNNDWGDKNISTIKLNKSFLVHPTLSINSHILFKLKEFREYIDIVHIPYTSNSHLAYPMLLANKMFGILYIITIHGGGMHSWKPKMLHSLFFKYADSIVAVSKTIKKEYEKRSGRKIEVIFPMIPFKRSSTSKKQLRDKYGFKDIDTIILSLGSIKKIKGSDLLLDAFLNLGKKYIEKNNLKLLYVGEGPLKITLQEKSTSLGLKDYVKFAGNILYEDVPEAYKISDIYVIPSLFEGTPKSLLEAIFNRLCVIGTDTNGINEIITHGENGLLFQKNDCEDLHKKIRTTIENPELKNKFSSANLNSDLYYGLTTTVEKYESIYGFLLKE